MNVYVGGEDPVTRAIARRIVLHCAQNTEELDFIDPATRYSGSAALGQIAKFVELGRLHPVVCVYDSDADCVVEILQKYAPAGWKTDFCAINIAIREAEAWLFSDVGGFSKYLEVDRKYMLEKKANSTKIDDSTDYKISYFLMLEIAPLSRSRKIAEGLRPKTGGKKLSKPADYNSLLLPFIEKYWDIDSALINSQSLSRTVARVREVMDRFCEDK